MKKMKFFLPVIAFLFAIVAAFATTADPTNDWIVVNSVCTQISEQSCDTGSFACLYSTTEISPRQIFDEKNTSGVCVTAKTRSTP